MKHGSFYYPVIENAFEDVLGIRPEQPKTTTTYCNRRVSVELIDNDCPDCPDCQEYIRETEKILA